jgi:hypothetical protein
MAILGLAHPQGGQPPAIFHPHKHPMPNAYAHNDCSCYNNKKLTWLIRPENGITFRASAPQGAKSLCLHYLDILPSQVMPSPLPSHCPIVSAPCCITNQKMSLFKKVFFLFKKTISVKTRTGNRYQAQSNFDVTSFRHQLISSSFSSSRSNRDVISFRSDIGTNQRTNGPTNGPT